MPTCCIAQEAHGVSCDSVQHLSHFVPHRVVKRWMVWTPYSKEPLKDPKVTVQCDWSSGMRLPGYQHVRMCLGLDADPVSESIRTHGRWNDCAAHVDAWQAEKRGDAIFLEFGGNIGSCTLEMLLRTNASVVVFEPNPRNLFLLTSTLYNASRMLPDLCLAQRVRVFPYAVGNESSTSSIYQVRGNPGDSIVGGLVHENWRRPWLPVPAVEQVYAINTVAPDEIFSSMRAGASIRLLKMDIQGYECRAVQGMQDLFQKQVINTMNLEVWERGLQGKGCSGQELRQMLKGFNFTLRSYDFRSGAPLVRNAWLRHPSYEVTATLRDERKSEICNQVSTYRNRHLKSRLF